MVADLFPLRVRDVGVAAMMATSGPVMRFQADDGELLRVFNWESAEAHGVEQLEDGSIGADAEGQGEDGDGSEARIEAE